MNIVDKLRSLPPRSVCEHGSIKVECVICELHERERCIAELEEIIRYCQAVLAEYRPPDGVSSEDAISLLEPLDGPRT